MVLTRMTFSFANLLGMEDIVIEVSSHMDLDDLSRLMLMSAQCSTLPMSVWDFHMYRLYSREFWDRASKRPRAVACPLGNSMLELKRLTEFKACLHPHKWKEADFYKLWEVQDSVWRQSVREKCSVLEAYL